MFVRDADNNSFCSQFVDAKRVARREEGCYSKQGRNGAELLIANMGFVSWDGMVAAGLDGLR